MSLSVLVIVRDRHDRPPGLPPAGHPAKFTFGWDLDGVRRALPETEVVLLWNLRSRLLRQAWPSATRLEWVHTAGAGVDSVIFPELAASEVLLTNSRGVFDEAMAEYAMALMLAAAKDLPVTIELQARHEWRFRLTETLAGKRLVVIGPGSIGRAVARRAAAFGMEVSAVGRRARDGDVDFQRIVDRDGLIGALAEADYVVLTVPLTPASRGMLGPQALAAMRPTARLVNLARGGVVDEPALVEALAAKRIAWAALDVFADEPLDESSPLWDLPNVLVSPHMSGDTAESEPAVVELFLDNLDRWTRGMPLRNVVDKRLGFVPS